MWLRAAVLVVLLPGGAVGEERRVLVADAVLTFASDAPLAPGLVAREVGGVLVQSDPRTIVLRVPVSRLFAAIVRAGALGEIVHRDVWTADAGEDLGALTVRIDRADRHRARLLELLQLARDVDEALDVEDAIAVLDEEIDWLRAETRFLEQRASVATLTLRFGHPGP